MPSRHAGPVRAGGDHAHRLDGLDAARGLAVLSMLVAHLSPVGGVLELSEYLTAPLFAVVVGAALGLRLERAHVPVRSVVVDNVLRGLFLVLLGVLLQLLYGQIDVVLASLGVLVIVLPPVALALRRVPVLALGVATGLAVLGPGITDRARETLAAHPDLAGGIAGDLLRWTAAGAHYRLVSFLPMAIAGVLVARLLPRLADLLTAAATATVLLAGALVVHLVGRSTAAGAAAYSGTAAEVVAATLLATGAIAASFAVVALARDHLGALRPVLEPVLATGRLALTAYTLQVLVLAAISLVRDGAPDDTWPILLGTTVVVVGACWALDRTVGTGPLEVAVRALRLPTHGRHAGAVSERPAPAPSAQP